MIFWSTLSQPCTDIFSCDVAKAAKQRKLGDASLAQTMTTNFISSALISTPSRIGDARSSASVTTWISKQNLQGKDEVRQEPRAQIMMTGHRGFLLYGLQRYGFLFGSRTDEGSRTEAGASCREGAEAPTAALPRVRDPRLPDTHRKAIPWHSPL